MRPRLFSFPFLTQIQVLFFVSGFSALVLEVVFVKLLRYWVGNTAHAVAAVLCAFMAGLAFGSLAAGKWLLGSKRLLALYGGLELLVGLYSLGMPWLMERLQPGYLALTLRVGADSPVAVVVHFVIAVTLLSFPTLLMGASFPLVVRAASVGTADRPEAAEKLYAANLLGAASGALLVDFVLLRFWGIGNTLAFVAATNLSVALWAFILEQSRGPTRGAFEAAEARNENRVKARGPVLAVAMAGGFLVLFQEIVWTRMAGEFLDSSVYGFAVMLFAVLWGLAMGALLVTRRLGARPPIAVLSWACMAAGGSVMVLVPFWDNARALAVKHPLWTVSAAVIMLGITGFVLSPGVKAVAIWGGAFLTLLGVLALYLRRMPEGSNFWVHHTVDFSVSVIFMLVPAVLMGVVLPLVLAWHLEDAGMGQASVAPVYSANTVGCLMGTLAGTFWLIPRFGVERSGRAAGLAFLALGLIFWWRRAKDPWRAVWVLIPALAWTFLLSPWDYSKDHTVLGHQGKVVYAREDLNGGLTTVLRYAGIRQIYVNGVYEAGNDYETLDQARCALLPLLHVKEAGRATVIGLGSGQTAGIVARYPFRSVDVVDYSPGVVEAARMFFEDVNFAVLNDPRVKVHVADGRHYLLTHPEKTDLITIEVSRLWQAGEGDLYTREFYQICSARLRDGGVLQQWVPLYNLSIPDTLVILRTVRTVFPYVAVYMGVASGMIVAARSPLAAESARLKEIDADPELGELLTTLGMTSAGSLLGDCVLTPQGLDALLARVDERRISTDLWPHLEYSNARQYLEIRSDAPLRRFLLTAQVFRSLPVLGADEATSDSIQKQATDERNRLLRTLPPL